MAVAIVIAFAVCWAPFNVQQFILLFAPEKIPQCSLVYSAYSKGALVLAVAYFTINPAICFIFVRNYRLQASLASLRSQLSLTSKSTELKRQ